MKTKILNEEQVLKLLGVSLDQLTVFRQERGLPFLQVDRRTRLYFEQDIIDWLKTKRTILSQSGNIGGS